MFTFLPTSDLLPLIEPSACTWNTSSLRSRITRQNLCGTLSTSRIEPSRTAGESLRSCSIEAFPRSSRDLSTWIPSPIPHRLPPRAPFSSLFFLSRRVSHRWPKTRRDILTSGEVYSSPLGRTTSRPCRREKKLSTTKQRRKKNPNYCADDSIVTTKCQRIWGLIPSGATRNRELSLTTSALGWRSLSNPSIILPGTYLHAHALAHLHTRLFLRPAAPRLGFKLIILLRYSDDEFEYRHVQLPKAMLKVIPSDYHDKSKGTLKLLWEDEWRAMGITQVRGIRRRITAKAR